MQAVAQEPLAGHPRYRPLRDLNSGTFGFVQLALDTKTNEEVRALSAHGFRLQHSVGPLGNTRVRNRSLHVSLQLSAGILAL